jgi:hypothetical protein
VAPEFAVTSCIVWGTLGAIYEDLIGSWFVTPGFEALAVGSGFSIPD